MKLDKKLLDKVSKITCWKYEEDLIVEEVEDILESLLFKIEELEEYIEDLEEDNFVPTYTSDEFMFENRMC